MTVFEQLVRKTPVVPLPGRPGSVLKLESLQRTGSFKLRGACIKIDSLSPAEREAGVVTASAGNHGLGVALAARTLGVKAQVFVPASAPTVKRRGIAALGAEVIEVTGGYDDAERAARQRAAERGATFVSAYDDEHIWRGNGGTLAEELLEQVPDLHRVVVPVGGGGLVSGILDVLWPRGVRVAGAQPAANCAMHESLRIERALTDYTGNPTLAEGCEGAVAERTYRNCERAALQIALVSEPQIRAAVAFAYHQCGQIIEPTAAVSLAAVLAEEDVSPTAVVITGGNVDPDKLDGLLLG